MERRVLPLEVADRVTSDVRKISTIRYSARVSSRGMTAAVLLRQARQAAGLSQVELAAQAGVTQSMISAYESGHRQPSLPTLAALIEAAGYELTAGIQRRAAAAEQSVRAGGPAAACPAP